MLALQIWATWPGASKIVLDSCIHRGQVVKVVHCKSLRAIAQDRAALATHLRMHGAEQCTSACGQACRSGACTLAAQGRQMAVARSAPHSSAQRILQQQDRESALVMT
jgi:hypothetical protein